MSKPARGLASGTPPATKRRAVVTTLMVRPLQFSRAYRIVNLDVPSPLSDVGRAAERGEESRIPAGLERTLQGRRSASGV